MIDLGLLFITIWLVGPYGLLVVLDQPPWEHTPKNEGIYSFLSTNQFANAVRIGSVGELATSSNFKYPSTPSLIRVRGRNLMEI